MTIPNIQHSDIQNIAILRLGTLGDAMLTTPLYSALKDLFPDARITVFASEWNAVIAENHAAVNTVVRIPGGFAGLGTWIRTLFTGTKFDLYIDPKDHRSTTSRFVAECIRAHDKLVAPGNLPLLSSAEIVPPPAAEHFTDSALAPLAVLDPDRTFERRPSINIPEDAHRNMQKIILQEKFYLVNVSAGSPTRRWTEEKWKQVVEALPFTERIIVISGPDDSDMARRIAGSRRSADYVQTGNLMEAAALIEQAQGLITSDTSVVHLASAFNTPIVALYFNAPHMMAKFSPLSDIQRIVLARGQEPVSTISVEEVLTAICETFTNQDPEPEHGN